jgi:hypothetical protein
MLTTSKVLLGTKVDLLVTKVVTKVTRGTQARHTLVPTLDTKVVRRVTKEATPTHPTKVVAITKEAIPTHPTKVVAITKEATPTHPTKVVAILATVVVYQAIQAREATRTTNEL